MEKQLSNHLDVFPLNNLPDDILELVLNELPAFYLCKEVILVCKFWKGVLETEHFWVRKGVREGIIDNRIVHNLHSKNVFIAKKLCVKRPFHRNLIKNPCGEEGFQYWCVNSSSSYLLSNQIRLKGYLRVDDPIVDFSRTPFEVYQAEKTKNENVLYPDYWSVETGSSEIAPFTVDGVAVKNFSALLVAYKFQLIDLLNESVTKESLNREKPSMVVSENYAKKGNFTSRYSLTVKLLSDTFDVIDQFEQQITMSELSSIQWNEIKFTFDKVPSNTRYVFYYHARHDALGYLGVNITNSSVRFKFSNGEIGRNLIRNPFGDENLLHWCVNSEFFFFTPENLSSRDKLEISFSEELIRKYPMKYYLANSRQTGDDSAYWAIETEHNGSQPFMIGDKIAKNFVTSYYEGTKFQCIDLRAEGIDEELLAALDLKVTISENYAARFDCGSYYSLTVKLLDQHYNEVDQFEFDKAIEQWNDGRWHQVKHVFEKIPTTARYILFYHNGCDTQFWAGFYGIKITNSSVFISI